MGEKTSKRFIAEAVPDGHVWRARFSAPGWVPDYVRDDAGEPRTFDTKGTAEFVAQRTLFEALNARPRWVWRNVHQRMGPDEFAAALAETGLSPTDFAVMIGTNHDRVMGWIAGDEAAPFYMAWLLPMLRDHPIAAEDALRIAGANTRRKD